MHQNHLTVDSDRVQVQLQCEQLQMRLKNLIGWHYKCRAALAFFATSFSPTSLSAFMSVIQLMG